MLRIFVKICSLLLFAMLLMSIWFAAPQQPVSARPPAQTSFQMLNYLYSISGNHTLAGQHNKEPNSNPAQYTNQANSVAGLNPALWSGDLLFGQSDINARQTMFNEALNQWNKGAVIQIMAHVCPPTQGEACAWDGGVVSHLSDTDWSNLVTNGTALNNAWKARMDTWVPYFQFLKDNGAEVLFRPQHEMNQGVFWWAGRTGTNGTAKLFQITHDYLRNTKGLTNIIWVWDLQDFSSLTSDLNNYDPGSSYWDILALDVYRSDGQGYTTAKYNAMVSKAGSKPIAIGEADILPTSSELAAQPRWTFFMGWAELTFSANTSAQIQAVYGASNVITRNEMPGWGSTAPNPSRSVYVHLFEWKWADIANECETWLGPKGFGAVQISPPNDHAKVTSPNRPWWEVYQPVSYQLTSRMGNRSAFASMVSRCRAAGVEVYADVVINHMAAIATNPSVAGNSYANYNYPAAGYTSADFHWFAPAPNGCQADITNYQDRFNVQFCELVGLADLRTETTTVRNKIADYLVDLYNLGVRGYRIDAAKHIPVSDIAAILSNVNSRVEPDPYIVQEVMDHGGEPISKSEYYPTGDVNEFNYGTNIANNFRGNIANLQTFGPSWGLAPSNSASVFVDNHDMQRGGGGGGYLTYKDGGRYDLANVFMLAWPYGYPQVMSSFAFSSDDQGPPSDANGLPTTPDCGGAWVCEQRHRPIANMVAWRNTTTSATTVTNWWSNGGNQIAFGRGDRGFVAINNDPSQTLNQTLQTGLATGVYCNIIAGDYSAPNVCSGPTITVNAAGQATFSVAPMSAAAIHTGAILSGSITTPTRTAIPTAFAGQVVRQVNAGGGATGAWLSDQYFDQGNPYSDTSSAIDTSGSLDSSVAPQAVYQTARWNPNFTYAIPGLSAGQPYTVLLHFAELSFQSAGARKFNVAINGTNVLSAFDVYAAAGFKRAIGKTFNVSANSSGQIVIAFSQGGADNPMVSGIEIFSQSGVTPTATASATRTFTPTLTNTTAVTSTITRTPTVTTTPVSRQSAYPSGVAWAIPGTIQAENYDLGGETVAYHDNETANQGGQYRTSDSVDIEVTGDTGGGYNVGWTQANEWLEYTVNVATTGNYTLIERVASNASTGNFRIEFKGVDKTGTVSVPNTGGWQSWVNLSQTVSLSAGQQVMRIYFQGNDLNLNYVSLSTSGGSNLALGKPVSESGHNQNYVATNANDGSLTSYWEGTAYPNLLTVDLGSAQTISSIKIKLNPAWGARTQTLMILGSSNNVTFTTLKVAAVYSFDPATGNVVTISFTSASVRYMRLSVTTNSGAPAGQVAEFEIYP